MRALIVGYGSIGRRHRRVLRAMDVDTAIVSRRAVDIAPRFDSIAAALAAWTPDYVVISSRTVEHRDDVAALADAGFAGTVLIEKPLYDRATPMPANGFAAAFVAYNMRFHPLVQALRAALADRQPFATHAYVGQYLPDWRPGSDYRDSYSARRDQGGGVLRDLSHELDYLNWLLGGWTRLTACGGHFSNLEIDSDDVFSVTFETPRCPLVTVHMNYLDTTARREVTFLTDKGSIHADFIRGRLCGDGKDKTYATAGDDTYFAEHAAVRDGNHDALCSIDQGLDVVAMIDAAERAAQSGGRVTR